MAFTNPILAGEALLRTGMRSDNYLAGVRGWRIASNGAAEFDNVGLRGNLWVPSITLNGQDLNTRLNAMPQGCIAWMSGFPSVSTTSSAVIMTTQASVVSGRWYEINLVSITPDQGNVKATEFHIKYTTDGSAPTGSSPALAISLRVSQFEMANVRAMWKANVTGTIKLAATIHSLDGQNVRCWAPGAGCVMNVYDMGIPANQFGNVGTSPPAKTLKEWTITASDSRSYHQNGTALGGTFDRDMCQGPNPNPGGSQSDFTRSYAVFSPTDISTKINDVAGVPLADIVTCEWIINWYYWRNGSGWGLIGHHNLSSIGSTESGGSTLNSDQYFISSTAQWTLGMIGKSNTFVNALIAGTAKGLVLGTSSGNEYQYSGVADGAYGTRPPQLHLKYYK